jgi:hypothetical protein
VTRNIICVHVGNKYTNDYVEKLYRSCIRNSKLDFTFTVLHDNKTYNLNESNIRYIPVEIMNFLGPHNMWWYKMQAFRNDVSVAEQNLLIDLDVVIVNNIDKFWDYKQNEFVIIQDFNRHWFPNYSRSNSSIVKFTPEIANNIFNEYFINPMQHTRKFRGDQDYFDEHVKDKVWWPKKWAMSWKWEVYNGGMIESNSNRYHSTNTFLDNETSVLVFHGKPDPHDVGDEIIKFNWV